MICGIFREEGVVDWILLFVLIFLGELHKERGFFFLLCREESRTLLIGVPTLFATFDTGQF